MALLPRLARAWQSQTASRSLLGSSAGQQQQQQALQMQQLRLMGGGGHATGNPNDYVTYAGLTLKKASGWEYGLSKLIGGTMWFWVFYMGYQNWDLKTKGLPAVFEAEGLDDDDHGHH